MTGSGSHAYARILSIDATEARRAPGVVAVVTAADMGDVELRYGHNVADHPLIADGSGEVIGRGYVRRDGPTSELPLFWEVAAVGIDVSVDDETGGAHVNRLVTVGDIGRAVNPQLAEGQDIGAAMMGLGVATREELVYDDGSLQNGNLFEYRVPRTSDLPAVHSILAQRADGVGPYGKRAAAKGVSIPWRRHSRTLFTVRPGSGFARCRSRWNGCGAPCERRGKRMAAVRPRIATRNSACGSRRIRPSTWVGRVRIEDPGPVFNAALGPHRPRRWSA